MNRREKGPDAGMHPSRKPRSRRSRHCPSPARSGRFSIPWLLCPPNPARRPKSIRDHAPLAVHASRRRRPPIATDGTAPLDDQLVLDPEIREAYLDDAQRCLASIEASLLAFESDSSNRQPLQQVCRELHTLKGASASVGMSQLAQFLHQVEDDLQSACEQPGGVEIEPILQCVDVVRRQIRSSGSEVRAALRLAVAQESRSGPLVKMPFIEAGTIRSGLCPRQGGSTRSADGHVGRTGDAPKPPRVPRGTTQGDPRRTDTMCFSCPRV